MPDPKQPKTVKPDAGPDTEPSVEQAAEPSPADAALLKTLAEAQAEREAAAAAAEPTQPVRVVQLGHPETDRLIEVDEDKVGPYLAQGWGATGESYLPEPATEESDDDLGAEPAAG